MNKYSNIFDKDFKKTIDYNKADEFAYVTHFLQNLGANSAEPFSEVALETLLSNEVLNSRVLNGDSLTYDNPDRKSVV